VEVGGDEPPTDEEKARSAAVPDRYTAREPFDEAVVPEDLLERFGDAASEVGAWFRALGGKGDEVTLAVLLARSDEIERADGRYEAELLTWLQRPADAGDGIPPATISLVAPQERASWFRMRDMRADISSVAATGSGAPGDEAEPPPVEHPLVCIIGTQDDDRGAWLQAGQALGRVLLEAAASGGKASPLTQVTEVAAERSMLAHGLGLVGHPQIVLRMGYAHGHPTTPRRPVESVLESVTTRR
jgi:hypothetical protein